MSGGVGRKCVRDTSDLMSSVGSSGGLWTGRGSAVSTPPDLFRFSLPQTVPGALRLFVNGEVGKCLARQRPPILGQGPHGAVK